jgi:hypothetical protein
VDRLQYRRVICGALQIAKSVPFRRVGFRDGSSPQPHECHENVNRFVSENPGCKTIRGWISIDRRMREAHSIVESPNGDRFDITPFDYESGRDATSFAEHIGDEEAFQLERQYQARFYCQCPRHEGEDVPLTVEPPTSLIDPDEWPCENHSSEGAWPEPA